MLEEMTYKEVDGLLYPQIEMPDETEDLTKLGKYGRMAMNYLKENEPARYKTLMRFGKMYEKMSAVEEEANQLYDQTGDAVSGEAQATESVIDNGDVEDKRAGEDAGRGSGTESDSDAIPLESDDTELNRELDEINSLGVSKEAEYTQASFFFDQNGQASIGTIHTEDEKAELSTSPVGSI